MRGFKNFLMRGDVIVVAVGLVVALAFSILSPHSRPTSSTRSFRPAEVRRPGLLCPRASTRKTFVDFGPFISAIIYFVIFMAAVYFVIVMPYKDIQARRGQTVFGDPSPVKTCPACLSSDLPAAASKCKYCGTDQPVTTA